MEKSIAELRDAVQSSLISTNKKISIFDAHGKEIEKLLENTTFLEGHEEEKKEFYERWQKKRIEIGSSVVFLLFAVNQLNAALNSLETAEKHVENYRNIKVK